MQPEQTTILQPKTAATNPLRMPSWLRQQLGRGRQYGHTHDIVKANTLHTVCESARCPNRGECWSRGTATFMLLGDICTRACQFCAVNTGRPTQLDLDEPRRIAEAVAQLGLHYVVLTSVNRDELRDGGASIYAETIRQLWRCIPNISIELLTPDFYQCDKLALRLIRDTLSSAPTTDPTKPQLVWGHNMETVPRLYRTARKGAGYLRSLNLLEAIARIGGVEAKSALMLGLGETENEVLEVLRDLRLAGVKRLAMGQYLRPTPKHLAVQSYVHPKKFAVYEQIAKDLGFSWVKAGPLVRSSYHAEEIQYHRG